VSVRDFSGRVEEARSVSAAFKTAGQLERVFVKEGDRVRRGQLLAVLDSADYVLGVNQLRVQSAQNAAETARHAKLHASGGMSDNDYEKVTAGAKQLAIQLALNEKKIEYCRLTAPTDGVVTGVNFEPGEMVDAGTPVIDLMDNTHLEVVVDLPVSEYLRRGEFAGFTGRTPRIPGRSFPLRMLSLTPKADNNQLYQLKLDLGGASGIALTPGMNVTVAIATENGGNSGVTVPASAVFDNGGTPAVFVYNPADSTIRATTVTVSGTGNADGSLTVTSGLDASQSVVRAGVHHLLDGEKVNVIPAASTTNAGNML
ncbi:MAG: efflux RND transporter periplasmic adaptor subunit, partial [Muribaculaceae bacterium]|nr:efflux RND transporter periplasmic adaptor subunit [Muribaculaceae bacterium]